MWEIDMQLYIPIIDFIQHAAYNQYLQSVKLLLTYFISTYIFKFIYTYICK